MMKIYTQIGLIISATFLTLALMIPVAYSKHISVNAVVGNSLFCETVEDALEIVHVAYGEDSIEYQMQIQSDTNSCFDSRELGLPFFPIKIIEKMKVPLVTVGDSDFQLWKVKLMFKVNTKELYTWASHKRTDI